MKLNGELVGWNQSSIELYLVCQFSSRVEHRDERELHLIARSKAGGVKGIDDLALDEVVNFARFTSTTAYI